MRTQGELFECEAHGPVCGLDEAGRGPLAGPVCAAAVVLPPDFPVELLNDSKKLSKAARERALARILELCDYGVGLTWPHEIDEINILNASMLAMKRAFELLPCTPGLALVDGNRCPELPCLRRAIVKGDATEPPIMAASILAKEARDRLMERYDWLYPEYGYARHKGYPSAAHRELCRRLGPSPIQRLSFNYSKGGPDAP
jgi:ribonuclease HII